LSPAFHVSPFEKAVILAIDGFGVFANAAWGVGAGATIRADGLIYFPHSLGVFYQAIIQYLGFPHYGDEYKVMGLAPYGRPTLIEAMRQTAQLRPDGTYACKCRSKFPRCAEASLSIYWIIRLRGRQVLVVGRLLVNGIRKSYEYGNCFTSQVSDHRGGADLSR
jgi:carbamoyltransferase